MKSFKPSVVKATKPKAKGTNVLAILFVAFLLFVPIVSGVGGCTYVGAKYILPLVTTRFIVSEPGFRVAVIEDSEAGRVDYTDAQKDAIESNADDSVRGIVRLGKGEYRLYTKNDLNTSKDTPGFEEMLKFWDGKTTPFIIVVNGRSGYFGKLDEKSIDAVRKYAPKGIDDVQK